MNFLAKEEKKQEGCLRETNSKAEEETQLKG